jgi:hypothetical protein
MEGADKRRSMPVSTYRGSDFRESRDQEVGRLSRETPKGTAVI